MSESPPIRVLLVDAHAIMRDGLRAILERADGFEVAGEAGDTEAAVHAAGELQPDVVVLDVQFPSQGGVDAIREIVGVRSDTHVMVLTASTSDAIVIETVAAGALGYLHKSAGADEVVAAVRDVTHGRAHLPIDVLRRAIAAQPQLAGPEALAGQFTARECQVLAPLAQGQSYEQMAAALGLAPLTVRNVTLQIRRKVGCATREELIAWAARHGYGDPADSRSGQRVKRGTRGAPFGTHHGG